MEKLMLSVFFFLSVNLMIAQSNKSPIPISIGYFGNYGFQAGAKIGSQFSFKNWETDHIGKRGQFTKSRSYYVSPQIGYFVRNGNESNFLLNLEWGYQRVKLDRQSFSAIALGLGYLMESEIISIIYNLGDGSIKERIRENKSYFLPTISYEFGKRISSKISWYGKPSLGWKLSEESSMVLFVEAGLKFYLFK